MHVLLRAITLGVVLASGLSPAMAGTPDPSRVGFAKGLVADGQTTLVRVAAAKLTGSVGHNLKKVNGNLQQMEKILKQTSRPKAFYKQAKDYLEEADYAYQKIVKNSSGKFDENHPDWLAATKRLAAGREALARYHRELVLGEPPAAKSEAAAGPAADGPLDSRVAYAIGKADADLKDIEKVLSSDDRPAHRLRRARESLADAEYKQGKVKTDFAGKFSESHPDWKAALDRLAASRGAIAAYEARQSTAKVQAEATPKPAPATPAAAKPEKAAAPAAAPPATPRDGPLNSLVARELRKAVKDLEKIEKILDPATKMDAGPAGKIAATKPYFEEVDGRLAGIRRNYAGKFSEAHPDFAAVVARHADAKAALAAHNEQHGGALAAKATYEALSYDGRKALDRMREVARRPLADYERDYALLSKALDGKVPADNPVLVEINTIIAAQRRWVAEAPKRKAAREAKAAAALSAKHTAALAAIRGRFKDLGATSALHGERVGQIVWSRDKAALDAGDASGLSDRFALTDPIYGNAFLARSLGNTAVWDPNTRDPYENRDFSYEVHLFIGEQEVKGSYARFGGGGLPPRLGQVVTVLPITPHPVPVDTGFWGEAENWRKATAKLPPGEYKIRVELWGGQHVKFSKAPLATGTFTLVKSAGERIAARGTFPGDNFGGADDVNVLKAQIAKNLVGLGIPLPTILDISLIDDWVLGAFTDTKQQWRMVKTAILYADGDGDGVCEYEIANFRSRLAGTTWGVLRKAQVGGGGGDVECPK